MVRKDINDEIIQRAVDALKKNVPVEIDIRTREQEANLAFKADFEVRMVLQNEEILFYAEVKANVTNAGKALALMLKRETPHPFLLVTRYVNPQMAEQLRQDGIEFIDTAGNAYINHPPTYIFIKGNRPAGIDRAVRVRRAFQPTGLKMIYAFLCHPGLEDKAYREIANIADIALGAVGWVTGDLKDLGYMIDMGKKGKKIIKKEDLLKRWVIEYAEKMRPKLFLGRFIGHEGWWQQKTLDPNVAQWGGEVAAARMTQYLKPEIVTVYTIKENLERFLIENRLTKDHNGDVEILERFWKPIQNNLYEDKVHPILVYADLLATGNQRNMETAKVIYERDIIRLIRET
jgi:hypothetical protein